MNFYQEVRSRLGARVLGFDYIFNYLNTIENPLIVETGCARQENNYEGDGQSSILFDKYIDQYGGNFWTVDICPESILYCRQDVVSERTLVYEMDSIFFLKKLNDQLISLNKKIDFLYLDSFDAPKDNPEVVFSSALHHLYELMAILPSLKPNALIGVDDNWNEDGQMKGKGQLIADYMSKIDNHPVLNSYQTLWKNL